MAEIIPNRVPCGKKPEPTPTPKPCPDPVVTPCDLRGVTYFKLKSDIEGDYTKNCGLLGDEIDKNFYFLRSMDIISGYTTVTDDGRKILVLKRVKCHPDIEIDITDDCILEMYVDDGYLIVNGEKITDKEGNPVRFLVEGADVHVVTDSSIQGDGSCARPLGVDMAHRTGTYAPADYYVDLTCSEKRLEDFEDLGYGHAVVTRERASRFGALYTYGQAKAIAAELERKECEWRIPDVHDWGKLLNAAESNENAKKHDTTETGNFGCIAGNRLKSVEFWDVEAPATEPVDDFAMAVYPVGVCPEVYNTKDPDEYGFMGLYGVASFWESGETHGQAYVRTFSYGHDDVAQFLESKASRRSIRLVRDIEDDFDIPEFADILGNFVEVVYIPEAKQLWTKLNINFTNYLCYDPKQVTVPEEWAEVEYDESGSTLNLLTEAKFYYNAWDGEQWHKKMMKEGESVVLLYEDPEEPCNTAATAYVTSANTNHEWRVFFNEELQADELIDTLDALKKEFQKEFDDINDRIDELSAATENLEDRLDSLEIASAETPDNTILASYILREGPDGDQKGLRIDIPKDKRIKEIVLGWSGGTIDEETGDWTYFPESGETEVLDIIYQNEEGLYKLVEIDLEMFISEKEYGDGLEVDNHILKVKIDPESDWFLTVSPEGVKLSGVDAAFDNLAHDVIGASGDTKSGYTVDFYDATWVEVSKEEAEAHFHTQVSELPDPKTWTGVSYIEIFDGETHGPWYKLDSANNYISDSDNVVEAIKAIDAALKEESDRAKAAEEDLQKQIDEEVSARTAADEDLQNQINEEVSARTEADQELWDALNEEISARTAADEALQEQIDELKAKAIEPLDESVIVEVSGNTTFIGVQIDQEDEHIKLGENGIWFEGDFGEFQD